MSEKRLIDANALRAKVCGWFHRDPQEADDRDDCAAALCMAIDEAPTVAAEPVPITGDTSDGYHTFNELYHHRAVLFSVICNDRPAMAWKSRLHHDGTMYDGMFIVGIQTPEGQATYHYDIEPYWDAFKVKELPQAPEWDGHTPDEAIRRIGNLAAEPVRYARWITHYLNSHTCSVCNWEVEDRHRFCPGCGARMHTKEDAE